MDHLQKTEKDSKYLKKQVIKEIGVRVSISKYKNIFAKGYVPNWSEEVFVIKKVKNTVPWTYLTSDLKGEEIVERIYEKELQKKKKKLKRV